MRHLQTHYSGPTSIPYYCTDCTATIQTVYNTAHPTPKFCPFCGGTNLIDDESKHTTDHAASLKVSIVAYKVLREEFRQQKAFVTFSEYVHCMMHGAKPKSEKELQDAMRARMRAAI